MTDDRFDTLLASLARARSRRETLGAVAVSLTAATALGTEARTVDVTASICRGRNEKCKRKSECCSEQCHSRNGKKKRRKCSCTPEGERCLDASDCCKIDVPLFCVSGFCVRER